MISAFRARAKNILFDPEYSTEFRLYMSFTFMCFLIGFIAVAVNTVLYDEILPLIPQWLYIGFLLVVLFLPYEMRVKIKEPQVIFHCLVYVPYVYFLTDAYHGTALLFAVLSSVSLALLFNGKKRAIVMILDMIVNVGCILAQEFYPHLVVMHDQESVFFDFAISIVMVIAGAWLMMSSYGTTYKSEARQLAEITVRDPLTGAYNRRHLFTYLN